MAGGAEDQAATCGEREHLLDHALAERALPDEWRTESRVKKACGRAREVVVVNYGGRASDLWWERVEPVLGRLKNLSVIDLPSGDVEQLVALYQRGLRLNCMIEEGELRVMSDTGEAVVRPAYRQCGKARS